MIDLDAIRKRCEAATEGPWYLDGTSPKDDPEGFCHRVLIAKTSRTQSVYAEPEGGAFPENDRTFIAHARQDTPDLLDDNTRLREALERLFNEFRNSGNLDKDQLEAMQQAADMLKPKENNEKQETNP